MSLLLLLMMIVPSGAVHAAHFRPRPNQSSQAAPKPKPPCVTGKVHYFADAQHKEGPYAFGRNPDRTGVASGRRLGDILDASFCVDPALTRVFYRELVDPSASVNKMLSLSQWRREVATINRRVYWKETTAADITMISGTYTYEMIPHPHGPPTIKKVLLPQRISRFIELFVRTREGTRTLFVRVKCRFQPVFFPAWAG